MAGTCCPATGECRGEAAHRLTSSSAVTQSGDLGAPRSWAARVQASPVGHIQPLGCWGSAKPPRSEGSCSLPCRRLLDRAVLAVCKAVYYQHVNNLSQCLITWKGNQSCGSYLKSMPISLALGKDWCFFVFHSRNKYVTTDPASKGYTYL